MDFQRSSNTDEASPSVVPPRDSRVKVTVNLPSQQVEFLQTVAHREGMTVTDIIKRAINSEKFFVEAESANRKILVEDGKRIREIIRK